MKGDKISKTSLTITPKSYFQIGGDFDSIYAKKCKATTWRGNEFGRQNRENDKVVENKESMVENQDNKEKNRKKKRKKKKMKRTGKKSW
ncbi:hypothetical protein CR513_52811, partial [Mucuna pruriens]